MSHLRTDSRSRGFAGAVLLIFCLLVGSTTVLVQLAVAIETIVEIRVHGNRSIPDEEVLALADIVVGDQVGQDLISAIERRLEESGRFETFDVRKRYQSLTTTDQVSIILVVRERPVAASGNFFARSVREVARRVLILPIVSYAEGYGFTYGVRTSIVDVLGNAGRLSVPATWDGERRVALEADKTFATGVIHRLQGGTALSRRTHPHFEINEDRTEFWVNATHELPVSLRLGAHVGWVDVRFGTLDDRMASYRANIELDTRSDVTFPRDAMYAVAEIEWLDISGRRSVIRRPRYELSGFKGLIGQTILAVRARYQGASAPLPSYEQILLGGVSSLRGWKVGELIGDLAVAASAELRFPLNSALSVRQVGVSVFYDTATAYAHGQSLRKQRFHKGAGAGIFLRAPVFYFRLDIAHDIVDSVRAHATAALSF